MAVKLCPMDQEDGRPERNLAIEKWDNRAEVCP